MISHREALQVVLMEAKQGERMLSDVADLYAIQRRGGHTTAMLQGALNTPGCVVLCANQIDAERLAAENADLARVVSIHGSPDRLRGWTAPIAIDNHAVVELCRIGGMHIRVLLARLEEVVPLIDAANNYAAMQARRRP